MRDAYVSAVTPDLGAPGSTVIGGIGAAKRRPVAWGRFNQIVGLLFVCHILTASKVLVVDDNKNLSDPALSTVERH